MDINSHWWRDTLRDQGGARPKKNYQAMPFFSWQCRFVNAESAFHLWRSWRWNWEFNNQKYILNRQIIPNLWHKDVWLKPLQILIVKMWFRLSKSGYFSFHLEKCFWRQRGSTSENHIRLYWNLQWTHLRCQQGPSIHSAFVHDTLFHGWGSCFSLLTEDTSWLPILTPQAHLKELRLLGLFD